MGAQELRPSLLQAARSGDREAEEAFVSENLGLVRSLVARFNGVHDREELFQVGCVGLLRAIRRFDFTYEVAFSTYAVPLILGEIRQFLRGDGTVHVSRSARERGVQITRGTEKLTRELGRPPTLSELGEELGLTPLEVAEAEAARQVLPLGDWEQTLAAKDADPAERADLRRALSQLPQRERQVLILRFWRDCTQGDVGRILGVSQTQVGRLERSAIKRMQRMLEE